MNQEKNQNPGKKQEKLKDKLDQWIDKAEEFMDDTSEKIYRSDTYRKADKSLEKATRNIFRKAGRWWGKSKH